MTLPDLVFIMLKNKKYPICLSLLLFIPGLSVFGQRDFLKNLSKVEYDTSYISTYTTDYTCRLFGSVKYGQTSYNDNLNGKSLYYKPNSKFLPGIGINHGFLGLNIAINLPFLNQDDDKYGETKYYDLTARVFSPRFNSTLYLQYYRGFYLSNTRDMVPGWEYGDPYYTRGDIRSVTAGLDLIYIFNSRKFSYRAAVIQNEWQKKSSGSFLGGGSIIYNATFGDSSLVPSHLYYQSFYDGLKIDRSNNFSLGPAFGYAYTVVIKKHYFIMGSLNGSGTIGFTRFIIHENDEKVKSGVVFGLRSEILVSAGYNSEKWYFGLSFVNMSVTNQSPLDECTINYDTGMFRFNLVRRIPTKKPIRLLNS